MLARAASFARYGLLCGMLLGLAASLLLHAAGTPSPAAQKRAFLLIPVLSLLLASALASQRFPRLNKDFRIVVAAAGVFCVLFFPLAWATSIAARVPSLSAMRKILTSEILLCAAGAAAIVRARNVR